MFKLVSFSVALIAGSVSAKYPEQIGYFAGGAYRARLASDKLTDLWNVCQRTQDVTWDVPYEELDDLFNRRMNVTTCRQNDELAAGHTKVLHPSGVVGLVHWEDLGDHEYTGLFNGGSDKALIRLSDSAFPVPEAPGLAPSFAIKFLRDGMESVNMFGAVGFEPTDSWDFFANSFSNHIQVHQNEINRETIAKKFAEANRFVGTTGLGEFARFDQDGNLIEGHVPPFLLEYRPSSDVTGRFDGSTRPEEGDFRDQLKTIPAGSTLFEVWASNQPESHENHNKKHIANVRLVTDLITSKFGDERLFFQHETMRFDFEFDKLWRREHERVQRVHKEDVTNENGEVVPNPEPNQTLETLQTSDFVFPEDNAGAMAVIRGSIADYGCPFAWMIDGLVINPIN